MAARVYKERRNWKENVDCHWRVENIESHGPGRTVAYQGRKETVEIGKEKVSRRTNGRPKGD